MSRKTSATRREAFFRALAETGNQTVAAERARVSRSWVSLHRASDPEFRARIEGAVAEARERLRAGADGVAPARGWGSLDGEELAVRGTNGRRTQIARARLKQWTPRTEDRFLAVLAATCNVKAACAEVGLTAASAYGHRQRWVRFAERWDAAVEEGYMRIQLALFASTCATPENRALPDPLPIPPMSVDQALHLLHMHKNRVHGVGGKPGIRRRPVMLDDVRESILRKLEVIEVRRRLRAGEVTVAPEVLEEDRAQWAARGRGR